MKEIYLAHPFLEQEYGQRLTVFLEREGLKVVNPFRDVEQKSGIYRIMQKEMTIIPKMDALVVVITDAITRAVHMEAFFAWYLKIPVFVLWRATDKMYSWYPAFATAIVSDTNELIDAMRNAHLLE